MSSKSSFRKPRSRARSFLLIVRISGVFFVFCALFLGVSYQYIQQVDETVATYQAAIREQETIAKASIAERITRTEEQAARATAAQSAYAAAQLAKQQVLTLPGDQVDATACNPSTIHADPSKIDVLVNKKHCLQPLTFTPTLTDAYDGARLTPEAADAFNRLAAAITADGYGLAVTSSYRSYSDQVSTYNYWVSVSGRDGADTYSARPGYSEHQTGLALDVASEGLVLSQFGSSSAYGWLQAHAAEYGFIQRYYAGEEKTTGYMAEEWHYRYVGTTVAKDMQAKGVKTLEAYWGMSGGDY